MTLGSKAALGYIVFNIGSAILVHLLVRRYDATHVALMWGCKSASLHWRSSSWTGTAYSPGSVVPAPNRPHVGQSRPVWGRFCVHLDTGMAEGGEVGGGTWLGVGFSHKAKS